MQLRVLLAAALIVWQSLPVEATEAFLVENGEARAEIVISENPTRPVRLAAHELQAYVQKISGVTLPITTEPSDGVPVQVYVGRSPHTDRLNITAEGLADGAYRITSGENWLVLIGEDTEFTPIEPWAKNNSEIASGKLQREWNAITGALWGAPNALIYKERLQLPGEIGLPTTLVPKGKPAPLVLWSFDERGSFNAVCGFLRQLGVRWYLPGELGEVVPSLKSIPLPKIDETVRPDFPIRRVNIRFGVHGRDTVLWAMRLGARDPYGIQTAHGMDDMTNRDEIFAAHPDWFAMYGGKRRYEQGRNNQLCYSNEELFRETVRNVRAQFDHFQLDAVSVMPPDGYTAMCQCPLCEGKDTPERDDRGRLSDYVWEFVNRVAREVRKTHPEKKVLNCAYGVYTLPPLKIEKLEPNVVVSIVGGRRPFSNKPGQQDEFRSLREAWVAKTDNPLIIFENYPFTDRGWFLPSFALHSIGESINATKGISQGEDIWLSAPLDFETRGIGFNHLLVYFTQRMYWGGRQQDVDAMFREYCRLFYGPAEREMLAFFGYCEANWQEMEKDKSKADSALSLFAAAQAKVDPASVYGQRLGLIDDYLKGLRRKSTQLAQKRGPVPQLRLVGEIHSNIVIDGILDDEAWVNCPVASTGRLWELETGRQPIFGTTVKSAWRGGNLYFAIRCDEHPGEKLNIAATKNEDQAIWYGDVVEVELETEAHSYYQIAVSPAGAIVDLDRGAERQAWFTWDSQAEVAIHVADDYWTVEIRIPVTQDENDPLHQVIGSKPSVSLPWHINICRQRIRDNGAEYSALAPTGTDGFHNVMKFAHFYDGNSHQFEADPSVQDYLTANRAASQLLAQRQYADALAAFTALAEGEYTELQKSAALEQAATAAIGLRDFQQAEGIAARIPIEAVRKAALMQNLLAQQKSPDLLVQYGEEEFSRWPFWKAGEGYFARGRASAIAGRGEKAESDLTRALEFTSHGRTRQSILLQLGNNRERTLKDDAGALAAYRAIFEPVTQIGGADEFSAVQAAAGILTRQGKFDDALAIIRRVDLDRLRGYWRGSMLLSLGDTLKAGGRKEEARAAFQAVLDDSTTESRHRDMAQQRLQAIRPDRP